MSIYWKRRKGELLLLVMYYSLRHLNKPSPLAAYSYVNRASPIDFSSKVAMSNNCIVDSLSLLLFWLYGIGYALTTGTRKYDYIRSLEFIETEKAISL